MEGFGQRNRGRTKSSSRPWYNGGELKRRKRIAKYKLFTIEGKAKDKLRKSLRWVKKTCSRIIHGY